ncbi:N-acetylneuraminate synthase family protein [Ramlibacter sp.]|uniref:N-acetylneuraminate synthase family protein n=1 Tax=Ramlibacter sp. TaxID=1917967 RepID=UPI002D55DDBB|nr:N-acetylneuraminate synthase family protein [Ramlibacter sp.]HYD74995.1 N-acetylneuraminate synthase family protein [Ramlibacter sp.]
MAPQAFSDRFEIDGRPVGAGCPAYVIAEAGVAHFGSEEKAYRLVDLAADAGADAVKFQVFDVDALISGELPEWKDRLSSRHLPYEAFRRIQAYCRDKGITFFATAHDEPSLDFLGTLQVPVYKVGSGEVGNWPFLRRVASMGKPMIFSTGMYQRSQIGEALDAVRQAGNRDVAVLHCVTRYPTPPEEVSLGNMQWIRENHRVVTGYSDHTRGFHFPLAAVALGAQVIEKHITLDYDVPNAQDWKVSCGPSDLGVFIQQLREIEAGLGLRDSGPTAGERDSLVWASKSLVPVRDIPAGTVLQAADLAGKRPGTGIPPSRIAEVVGKTTRTGLARDQVIRWEQLS